MATSRQIDMLSGSLWDKLIIFALPLAFTGMLQQLYNAADVAVLGRFVSDAAMSAVGNNVPVIGFIVNLCMGLSLGANVVVARYLGMKNVARASSAVHTALWLAVTFGIAVTVIGQCFCDLVLVAMDVPETVYAHSEQYLRVYLLGMPFISIYNFLAALYRSRGDTQTPLWALLAASIFNIVGNLFFVLVCNWGVMGVAFATVLANLLSSSILLVKLLHIDGVLHIEPARVFKVDYVALRRIVRIGWPAALQGCVFSISNLIIQAAINSLGPEAMAGSVAAFTIEINVFCFLNAFTLATTTFVSQNYGARNLTRCREVTRVAMGLNFLFAAGLTAIVWLFAQELLGIFSASETVIALGITRIIWVMVPQPFCAIYETLAGAMRGYGYSLPPALVMLSTICSVRLIWVFAVFPFESSYEFLMMVYPISWVAATIGMVLLYIRHQKKLRVKYHLEK